MQNFEDEEASLPHDCAANDRWGNFLWEIG
jgi:hypothetical protein